MTFDQWIDAWKVVGYMAFIDLDIARVARMFGIAPTDHNRDYMAVMLAGGVAR